MRRRKIRKFAYNQAENNQTNGSTTEATLILCGYLGERANNRGDSTTERRMRRRKIRKFTIKQTDKEQSDGSKTEATLILCGYLGERANMFLHDYIITHSGL